MASGGEAAASAASTTHWRVDRLTAQWFLDTNKEGTFRYVSVSVTRRTNMDSGEVVLSSSAGQGLCALGSETTSCEVMMKPHEVVAYEADPAFAAASVVLRRKTQRHRISWTTSTPYAWTPPLGQEPNPCGGTTTKIYVSGKNATAEGRAFGRAISTADETSAYDGSYREAEDMIQTYEIEECGA